MHFQRRSAAPASDDRPRRVQLEAPKRIDDIQGTWARLEPALVEDADPRGTDCDPVLPLRELNRAGSRFLRSA